VIAAILAPPIIFSKELRDITNGGAGGAGPAGGGGGGNRGTGGGYTPERLRYMQVQKPAPAAAPAVKTETPVPQVVPPPRIEPPKPQPPQVEVKAAPIITPPSDPNAATKGSETSLVAGTGGGSGKDGSVGSGSGTGGGVGSGVGTGRGSGNGAGTGGGDEEIYPPTVISLPLLPLPVPSKVRPYKMIAYFEVDTAGRARLLGFNPSKDSGYNRRVREMLLEIRFRAAVRKNGMAVLDTAVVSADAP